MFRNTQPHLRLIKSYSLEVGSRYKCFKAPRVFPCRAKVKIHWFMGVHFTSDTVLSILFMLFLLILIGNSHSLKPECHRNIQRWNHMCSNFLCQDGNCQVASLLLVSSISKIFLYLSLAALGLRCCMWAFSSCTDRGLLVSEASLVAEHRL